MISCIACKNYANAQDFRNTRFHDTHAYNKPGRLHHRNRLLYRQLTLVIGMEVAASCVKMNISYISGSPTPQTEIHHSAIDATNRRPTAWSQPCSQTPTIKQVICPRSRQWKNSRRPPERSDGTSNTSKCRRGLFPQNSPHSLLTEYASPPPDTAPTCTRFASHHQESSGSLFLVWATEERRFSVAS